MTHSTQQELDRGSRATPARTLLDSGPVRIGLPLDGWRLAVVDAEGQRVPEGGTGELIIGGVGLARYLDPAKDAEKYAPFPTLGWERAYRSGDLVRFEEAGLVFVGRADDQVKLGGRRIELGEVDAALQGLDGRAQGRRRHPPIGRRVRRRRGAHVPPVGSARPGRPGACRALGGVRRLVRGDVARLGPRRLSGARSPGARALR